MRRVLPKARGLLFDTSPEGYEVRLAVAVVFCAVPLGLWHNGLLSGATTGLAIALLLGTAFVPAIIADMYRNWPDGRD